MIYIYDIRMTVVFTSGRAYCQRKKNMTLDRRYAFITWLTRPISRVWMRSWMRSAALFY